MINRAFSFALSELDLKEELQTHSNISRIKYWLVASEWIFSCVKHFHYVTVNDKQIKNMTKLSLWTNEGISLKAEVLILPVFLIVNETDVP